MKYEFIFDGHVMPMQRPRVTRSGMSYIPKETQKSKRAIARAFKNMCGDVDPFDGPVAVSVTIYRPMTKALAKKLDVAIRHGRELDPSSFLAPTKPDLDNQIKTVLDALEGLAYNNDSQVVDISAHKRYANYDAETEYAVIEISEIK